MNSKYHDSMTRNILSGELKTKAIDLVVTANKEADTYNFTFAPQHFQRKGEANNIASCKKFYSASLEEAVKSVVKGNPNRALYLLGRALHCVQDFYAHTNWVALENSGYCSALLGHKLRHCSVTTTWRNVKLANSSDHLKHLWKDEKIIRIEEIVKDPNKKIKEKKLKKFKENYEERKEWFKKMKNEDLEHPDLHLDYPGSFASKIIYEFKEKRPIEEGFVTAIRFAKEHTKNAWMLFCRNIRFAANAGTGRTLVSNLKNYIPGKINWAGHRMAVTKHVNNKC